MNIFKHPINGSWIIWARLKDGQLVRKIFYYHSLKQAKSLFSKEYPASKRDTKGCQRVQWAPFVYV